MADILRRHDDILDDQEKTIRDLRITYVLMYALSDPAANVHQL